MLAPRSVALPTLLVSLALAATGCGSDDSSDDATSARSTPTEASTTAGAAAGTAAPSASATSQDATDGTLTIDASEFRFSPATATAKAGKLRITMKNVGKVEHELVLLKTTTKADGLKVTGGRVSEDDAVGEVSETEGGASKTHAFTLTPGTYVYVCNIPGHYMGGMRGTLTVQ